VRNHLWSFYCGLCSALVFWLNPISDAYGFEIASSVQEHGTSSVFPSTFETPKVTNVVPFIFNNKNISESASETSSLQIRLDDPSENGRRLDLMQLDELWITYRRELNSENCSFATSISVTGTPFNSEQSRVLKGVSVDVLSGENNKIFRQVYELNHEVTEKTLDYLLRRSLGVHTDSIWRKAAKEDYIYYSKPVKIDIQGLRRLEFQMHRSVEAINFRVRKDGVDGGEYIIPWRKVEKITADLGDSRYVSLDLWDAVREAIPSLMVDPHQIYLSEMTVVVPLRSVGGMVPSIPRLYTYTDLETDSTSNESTVFTLSYPEKISSEIWRWRVSLSALHKIDLQQALFDRATLQWKNAKCDGRILGLQFVKLNRDITEIGQLSDSDGKEMQNNFSFRRLEDIVNSPNLLSISIFLLAFVLMAPFKYKSNNWIVVSAKERILNFLLSLGTFLTKFSRSLTKDTWPRASHLLSLLLYLSIWAYVSGGEFKDGGLAVHLLLVLILFSVGCLVFTSLGYRREDFSFPIFLAHREFLRYFLPIVIMTVILISLYFQLTHVLNPIERSLILTRIENSGLLEAIRLCMLLLALLLNEEVLNFHVLLVLIAVSFSYLLNRSIRISRSTTNLLRYVRGYYNCIGWCLVGVLQYWIGLQYITHSKENYFFSFGALASAMCIASFLAGTRDYFAQEETPYEGISYPYWRPYILGSVLGVFLGLLATSLNSPWLTEQIAMVVYFCLFLGAAKALLSPRRFP
jgi:hypothetical protein